MRLCAGDEQRVPIGSRIRHELRSDGAVGSGPVVHDHGLSEEWRHGGCEGARDDVRGAPCVPGHNDADGLVRKGEGGNAEAKQRTRAEQGAPKNLCFHWLCSSEAARPDWARSISD